MLYICIRIYSQTKKQFISRLRYTRARPLITRLPTLRVDNRRADARVNNRLPTNYASGLTRLAACPDFEKIPKDEKHLLIEIQTLGYLGAWLSRNPMEKQKKGTTTV